MRELWLPIKGFNKSHHISTFGRVKNIERNLILKLQNKNGYLHVSIKHNKIRKDFQAHRLVALAFLENPERKPQVNHINGKRGDNNINNLEWVTISENIKHSWNYCSRVRISTKKNKISAIKKWINDGCITYDDINLILKQYIK
ncbi:unnamed protein product [marine sediment metagenome]|uniref:HNH nuclease domain-containing protein n=1 Tax=marine sediment metagenome TaxID=412755 RepID=X0U6G0_9ZZZZ